MDQDDHPAHPADLFREFAMACRAERDRLALARLAAEDDRFESAHADRHDAESMADRAIAAAAGR